MDAGDAAVVTPAVVKAASAAAYASAGSAFAFGMTANEIGVIASITIGFLTFGVGRWLDYHFRMKHYLLEEEKHKLILRQWKETGVVDRRAGDGTRRDEFCITSPRRD